MRWADEGHVRRMVAAILAACLVFAVLATAQEKPDDDAIWKSFISWFRAAPKETDPFKGYAAKLGKEGVPETEVNGAELLGWAKDAGTIEAGKFADIVAVNGDPLADIGVMERVVFVMKGGEVVKNDLGRQR